MQPLETYGERKSLPSLPFVLEVLKCVISLVRLVGYRVLLLHLLPPESSRPDGPPWRPFPSNPQNNAPDRGGLKALRGDQRRIWRVATWQIHGRSTMGEDGG